MSVTSLEPEPLSTFEVQLISYFNYLKTIKKHVYLSYNRSSYEEPIYFHNSLSSNDDSGCNNQ